jgi:hypothetical protein
MAPAAHQTIKLSKGKHGKHVLPADRTNLIPVTILARWPGSLAYGSSMLTVRVDLPI